MPDENLPHGEQIATPSPQSAYALGWSIIPVGLDKKPLCRWKEFQTRRPTPDEFAAWCSSAPPALAVITGKLSGVVVVDFDGENGRKLVEKYGLKPHIRTGSGGYHLYIVYPGWYVLTLNSKTKQQLAALFPGLDIRADGGYAVFYGHNSNGPYVWLRSPQPDSPDVLPAEMRAALGLAQSPQPSQSAADSAEAKRERRTKTLVRVALRRAVNEGRNNAGFFLFRQLRDSGVLKDRAHEILKDFVAKCPPTNAKGSPEPYTENEAFASLEQAYSKPPEQSPESSAMYLVLDGAICRKVATPTGENVVKLCNFTARIIEETLRDDGVETTTVFRIEGMLATGEPLPLIYVTALEFSTMTWVTRYWGCTAVVYAGATCREHVRCAIQIMSEEVERRRILTRMGWGTQDGEWMYAHAKGIIGSVDTEIAVELPDALSRYALPIPPTGDVLTQAVRASLGLLDGLAPDRITFPLLALVYRAVLAPSDFSEHLAGSTGEFKSELAALHLQHFGAGLDARHLTASWHGTANAIEGLAFTAKDALIVVDDFAPAGSTYDVQKFHRDADRVLRGQGNNAGRLRMRPDASLRPTKSPRGTILSTGEDIPRGHSIRARMAVIEVAPGDVNVDRLTRLQADARDGKFAASLAGFIAWLAPFYSQIQTDLPKQIQSLRPHWQISGLHPRTSDIMINLELGLRCFLRFAEFVGALQPGEREALLERCRTALRTVSLSQTNQQLANEPARRFICLLSAALVAGRAHIRSSKAGGTQENDYPDDPDHFGWRFDGAGEHARWHSQGACIGWTDGDNIFLVPDSAYAVVQRLASEQGDSFGIGPTTLHKRLKERGYLASTDTARETITVRRVLAGATRTVLHVRRNLLVEKPDIPDIPPASLVT